MGSLVHDFRMAWRHFGGARQLRIRILPGQARFPRALDAHYDADRSHPVRGEEEGDELVLGDRPSVPRFARTSAKGRQLHSVHADLIADDLRYVTRSREDSSGHPRGALAYGADPRRRHGRGIVRVFNSAPRSQLDPGRLRRLADGYRYDV